MPTGIMAALGKVKPKEAEEDVEALEDDAEDIEIDGDEMAAAKAAYDATSPEEYAKALKAFVKICGGY